VEPRAKHLVPTGDHFDPLSLGAWIARRQQLHSDRTPVHLVCAGRRTLIDIGEVGREAHAVPAVQLCLPGGIETCVSLAQRPFVPISEVD
jgi:hypothetical protein